MRGAFAFPWARLKPDPLRVTAVLLPPLAVKQCGRGDLVPLNIVLTLLLWLPGVIHAWNIVHRTLQEREQQFVAAFRNHLRH